MNFYVKSLSDVLILATISLYFVLSCIPEAESLRCFQCQAEGNDQCGELKDCPVGQAYDRCMTTIIKNPKDGKRIRKECALAPCHLRGVMGTLNFANFMSDCDASKNQDCTYCCTGDGCNKDGACSIRTSPALQCLMFLAAIATLAHFRFN